MVWRVLFILNFFSTNGRSARTKEKQYIHKALQLTDLTRSHRRLSSPKRCFLRWTVRISIDLGSWSSYSSSSSLGTKRDYRTISKTAARQRARGRGMQLRAVMRELPLVDNHHTVDRVIQPMTQEARRSLRWKPRSHRSPLLWRFSCGSGGIFPSGCGRNSKMSEIAENQSFDKPLNQLF